MQDASFPGLHVRPRSGWVNDPNGPIVWRGRYHLCFQYNPTAPVHGDIHWGHASSTDLVHWRLEPVALAPTPGGPDAVGCWSGCAVEDGSGVTAVYTGVADASGIGPVCLAHSQGDLLTWTKNPVAAAHPPDGIELMGFRDPFVFRHQGARYAVVGAGRRRGGAPLLLLYGCDDLRRWAYLGVLLDASDTVAASVAPADVWECPQLVELGDRWVLILALNYTDRLDRVVYLVGDLQADGRSLRFRPSHGGLADAGHDFYAASVLVLEQRALMWGWSWEDRPADDVLTAGWAGVLTFPRVLSLSSVGRLVSTPAPELDRLRVAPPARHTVATDGSGDSAVALPPGPVDIQIRLLPGATPEGGRTTVTLGCDPGQLRLILDPQVGTVTLERATADPVRAQWATAGDVQQDVREVELRVLVDGSLVEIFVTGGPTFTERLYPSQVFAWRLTLAGPAQTRGEISVWSLSHPRTRERAAASPRG